MDIPALQFVPAPDYLKALVVAIPKAKKRIVIHAMGIMWGSATEQLLPALRAAAGRGVEVRLVGDIYSKFYAKTQHLGPRAKVSSWSHIEEINRGLQETGVHVTYVGTLGINPFKNRCHSKITLIDDLVYTFGGINFTDDGFTNHDYMLHVQNSVLADRLYQLVRDIEADQRPPLPDLREHLAADTTLLFDGGTAQKSAIYETACGVVATAKKSLLCLADVPERRTRPAH